MLAMIVEEEHLIEPHTSDDKGARPRQAFGGTGLEVARLNNALKEQLDGFAPIGIQVLWPRVRGGRHLLGGEQPAALLRIEGNEVRTPKSRVTQQELPSRGVGQQPRPWRARCFPPPSWDTSGQRGAHGGGKHQPLQDQAIALHPPPIAALGPCRLDVHVTQPRRNALLLSVPFVPQRALGLVHPPINRRGLGFVRPWCHFLQNLLTQYGDLSFRFRQGGVQPPLHRAPMRNATKPQPLPQAAILRSTTYTTPGV